MAIATTLAVLEVVMLIVSLVSVAAQTGMTVSSQVLNFNNSETRKLVLKAINAVTQEMKSGRLSLSNIISALQNNNTAALTQLLYHNPLVSKTLDEINADSRVISDIQNRANQLESLIASLESQLQSLGFAQSHSGRGSEEEQRKKIEGQLSDAMQEYNSVIDQARNTKVSATRQFKVDTSHLDAISQNINGGLKS